MFQNPRAPYTTSNNFTNFTPNFYTRPYILSHVVPTFFTNAPPPRSISKSISHSSLITCLLSLSDESPTLDYGQCVENNHFHFTFTK